MTSSYFNLIMIFLPAIFSMAVLSFSFYLFYIFENKRILNTLFFEVLIFFLPLLSLIISLYLLTGYKNPFFSFSLIFLIFSYITFKINIELKREISFLLFLFFLFFFSSSLTLYIDSEKMLFVKGIKDIFYSWNILAKFLSFLLIAIIFVSFIKKIKLLFYASIFLLPIFLLWDTITIPDVSFNNLYFIFTYLFLISLFVLYLLFDTEKLFPKAFYISIFFIPLFLSRDLSSFYYVSKENFFLKKEEIKKKMEELPKVKEEVVSKKAEISGKEIFDNTCSSCHSFDKKVVGPAFRDVLPKYKDNIQKLKSFIKKPYKVNPEFPPMPQLGLKDEEIDAVVKYLFKEIEKYEK